MCINDIVARLRALEREVARMQDGTFRSRELEFENHCLRSRVRELECRLAEAERKHD